MPNDWKILRGVESEYRYSFPSRSPYANGKSADKVHLTSNQGVALIIADGGWSIAIVGARCLFAHSMIPFIFEISSPPSQVGGSKEATIKSTETDGKSVWIGKNSIEF